MEFTNLNLQSSDIADLEPTPEKFGEQVIAARKKTLENVINFEIDEKSPIDELAKLYRILSPGEPQKIEFIVGNDSTTLDQIDKQWEKEADDMNESNPSINFEYFSMTHGVTKIVSFNSHIDINDQSNEEKIVKNATVKVLFSNRSNAQEFLEKMKITTARSPSSKSASIELGNYSQNQGKNKGEYAIVEKNGFCFIEFNPEKLADAYELFENEELSETTFQKELSKTLKSQLAIMKQNSESLLQSDFFQMTSGHITEDILSCFDRLANEEKQHILLNMRRSAFNIIKLPYIVKWWSDDKIFYEKKFKSVAISRGADYGRLWGTTKSECQSIAENNLNQPFYGALVSKFDDGSGEHDEAFTNDRLLLHFGPKIRLLSRITEEDFDNPSLGSNYLPADIRRNIGETFYDTVHQKRREKIAMIPGYREARSDIKITLSREDIEEICIPDNLPNKERIEKNLREMGYTKIKIVDSSKLRKFKMS